MLPAVGGRNSLEEERISYGVVRHCPFPSLPVSKGAATISSTAGADSACRAGLSDETLLANICKGDRKHSGCFSAVTSVWCTGLGEGFSAIAQKRRTWRRTSFCTSSGVPSLRQFEEHSAFLDRPDDVFSGLKQEGYLTERHYYAAVNLEGSDAEKLAAPIIAEYDHSGEAVFGRRRWRRIREMLTEDQWETVRLHFFEGCTFAEIGEKRNQPVGNVRHHFYRGWPGCESISSTVNCRIIKGYGTRRKLAYKPGAVVHGSA